MIMIQSSVFSTEIFVSTKGNDDNPGTKGKPVASIIKARELARKSEEGIKVTVYIESGYYHLTETFELDERDSNTNYIGLGIAVLSGGYTINLHDLQKVSDKKILQQLPEKSQGLIRVLKIKSNVKESSKKMPLRFRGYAGWPECFMGDKPLWLARWPNKGYVKIKKVLDSGSKPRNKEKPDRGGRFKYSEDNPNSWRGDKPIYLGGYWCYKWYDEFIKVKSIDKKNKIFNMEAPHVYGIGGPSGGLYYAINLLEELDVPGEYVFDKNTGLLFIYPLQNTKLPLSVSVLNKPLLKISNAKNIVIKNLNFENCLSNAIQIKDSNEVLLKKCVVRKISGSGVSISGGTNCGVESSVLKNIGKTGVVLSGGNRVQLKSSKHFVVHCKISHFARLVKTYCPAIQLRGTGQIAKNNYLHSAPHCAILFSGNDHEISFNHIEKVCLDTSDAGAIYCGRDWTLAGNRIHGNYIHNLGSAVHHNNWAVYLDDMASGIEVSNNIVSGLNSGMLIGGGRSNKLVDNLFIDCKKLSIRFDARGVGWAKRVDWLKNSNGSIWKKLKETPYQEGVWKKRFPYLDEILGDVPQEPRRNVILGNLSFNSPGLTLDPLVVKYGEVKGNITHDKKLVFQFNKNSLIFSEEKLKPFSLLKIGPKALD